MLSPDETTHFQPDGTTELDPGAHMYRQYVEDIPTLDIGQHLGQRYQIVRKIGSGASASTYQAIDVTVPGAIPCLIKQLDPIWAAQHEAEVRRLARVQGGGTTTTFLPDIYAFLPEELCLIMTWVDGQNVRELLVNHPELFTQERIIALMIDVAASLVYLHSQQPAVIHSDIKPSNLICDPNNHIWLVDFGISAGTPGYRAPEQLSSLGLPASDCYALGMTAAVLLTHVLPQYEAPSDVYLQLLMELDPALDRDLVALIGSLLRADPQRRPTAIAALQALLSLRERLQATGAIESSGTTQFDHQIRAALGDAHFAQALELIEANSAVICQDPAFAREIIEQLQAAVERSELSKIDRAMHFAALGELYWRQGELQHAQQMCQKGLTLISHTDTPARLRGMLYARLGACYGDQWRSEPGAYARAMRALRAGLRWSTAAQDSGRAGQIFNNIGRYRDEHGDTRSAEEAYVQSLTIKQREHDLIGTAMTLLNLGLVTQSRGEHQQAKAYYQRCRDISKQAARADLVAGAIAQLGILLLEQGDLIDARRYLTAATELYQSASSADTFGYEIALCEYNLGEIAIAQQHVAAAAAHARTARELVSMPDEPLDPAFDARIRCVEIFVALAKGESHPAASMLADNLENLTEPSDRAFYYAMLAAVALDSREWQLAKEYIRLGRRLARSAHLPWLEQRFSQVHQRVRAAQNAPSAMSFN